MLPGDPDMNSRVVVEVDCVPLAWLDLLDHRVTKMEISNAI